MSNISLLTKFILENYWETREPLCNVIRNLIIF
jgi:hypothetical protein